MSPKSTEIRILTLYRIKKNNGGERGKHQGLIEMFGLRSRDKIRITHLQEDEKEESPTFVYTIRMANQC